MSSEEIVLEIEGTPVQCKKEDLISNSDYFKAMLEGNFVEKNQNIIQLKDVNLKSMNIILTLLRDSTYYIEDEDLLMVLQTACMLQFEKIRTMCLNKTIRILSVKNCLKIWMVTEQLGLKPLYLKAKAMALTEFMVIKESNSILELSLDKMCNYIGSVNLRTDNELSVFQTAMKWWYENSNSCVKELIKLLHCIDFKSLPMNHFKEITTYPGVANTEVEEILKCLYNIINKITSETFSEEVIDIAVKFRATKSRIISGFPCLTVKSKGSRNEKRMRYNLEYDTILHLDVSERIGPNQSPGSLYVVYMDQNSNGFKEFFPLKLKPEGCKLMGYKEYVFVYGGEFQIGRGQWNTNFWAYDTIREHWQIKSPFPFPRRHFKTCLVGSKVFIVGGTGQHRVNKENFFWYDFKEDTWSKEKHLPIVDMQVKCCNFLDKFFLFSITNGSGHFFENFERWISVPIQIDKSVLDGRLRFSIFSYKNKLYVKGKKLIEFIFTDNELQVSSIKEVTNRTYSEIQTVVCNNIAFTLYGFFGETINNITETDFATTSGIFSLEKFNLETGDIDFVFENLGSIDIIQSKKESLEMDESLQLFSFFHHSIMELDDLVNDYF